MRHLLPATLFLAAVPLGLSAADPPRVPAAARVMNPDDARRRLGLLPDYAAVPGIKDVKVAVLDSGFDGVDGKRPYLPANAVVVEHYGADFVKKFGLGDPEFTREFAPGNSHGRLLAQLVWATTGGSPDGPQFYLLNANGPTMFRRAVRMAIELEADVILFGGTFEGAGNYDGRGPINAAVDEAVAAGIVWVNAAGNTGGMVYNGPVEIGPDGFLQFGGAKVTALRFRSRLDENAVTLTLTWNDYRDAEDAGTEKDLDLLVEDARGQLVGESKLVQVGPGKAAGEGQTKNPRERLTLTDLAAVGAGEEYRVRVKANTNFGPRDRVRLLLTPGRPPVPDATTGKPVPSVEFVDATRGGEVYPPADHAGVLTVGDATPASAVGPTADGRVKPDVVLADSSARFSNGEETAGASNAAAYFAGLVAVMRAIEPRLTAGHVREWVRRLDRESAGAAVAPVAPARDVVGLPPPPPLVIPARPLSPNEMRALRYSENVLDEKLRRGERNPNVIVSTPGGSYVVTPGGRAYADPVPLPVPLPAVRLPGAPAGVAPPAARPALPHAAWRTPSPRQLADLVRGDP